MDVTAVEELISKILKIYTPKNEEGLRQHIYRTYLGLERRLSNRQMDMIASLISYNYKTNQIDSTATVPIDIANGTSRIQTQGSLNAIHNKGSTGESGTLSDLIRAILNFKPDMESIHNTYVRYTDIPVNRKDLIELRLGDIIDEELKIHIGENETSSWMAESLSLFNPGNYSLPQETKTYMDVYLSAAKMEYHNILFENLIRTIYNRIGKYLLGIYISPYFVDRSGSRCLCILRLLSNAELMDETKREKFIVTGAQRKQETELIRTLEKIEAADYGDYTNPARTATSENLMRLEQRKQIIREMEANQFSYLYYIYVIKDKILEIIISGKRFITDIQTMTHPLQNFISSARSLDVSYINLNLGNMARHLVTRDDIIDLIGLASYPGTESYLLITDPPPYIKISELDSFNVSKLENMISNKIVERRFADDPNAGEILTLVQIIGKSLAPDILDLYIDKDLNEEIDNLIRSRMDDLGLESVRDLFSEVSGLFIDKLKDISDSQTIIFKSIFSVLDRRDINGKDNSALMNKDEYIERLVYDVNHYITIKATQKEKSRPISRFKPLEKIQFGKLVLLDDGSYTLNPMMMNILLEAVVITLGDLVRLSDYNVFISTVLTLINKYIFLDDNEHLLTKAYFSITENHTRKFFARRLAELFISHHPGKTMFIAEIKEKLHYNVVPFLDRVLYLYDSNSETNKRADINTFLSRKNIKRDVYSGANLIDLLLTPGIDPRNIWTTNTYQMNNIFGIEIARVAAHAGVLYVIEGLSSSIRSDHIDFLVSAVTHNATPTGIEPRSRTYDRTSYARQLSEGYPYMSEIILNRPPLRPDPYTDIIYGTSEYKKPISVESRQRKLEREGKGLTETHLDIGGMISSPPVNIAYTHDRPVDRGNIISDEGSNIIASIQNIDFDFTL